MKKAALYTPVLLAIIMLSSALRCNRNRAPEPTADPFEKNTDYQPGDSGSYWVYLTEGRFIDSVTNIGKDTQALGHTYKVFRSSVNGSLYYRKDGIDYYQLFNLGSVTDLVPDGTFIDLLYLKENLPKGSKWSRDYNVSGLTYTIVYEVVANDTVRTIAKDTTFLLNSFPYTVSTNETYDSVTTLKSDIYLKINLGVTTSYNALTPTYYFHYARKVGQIEAEAYGGSILVSKNVIITP